MVARRGIIERGDPLKKVWEWVLRDVFQSLYLLSTSPLPNKVKINVDEAK